MSEPSAERFGIAAFSFRAPRERLRRRPVERRIELGPREIWIYPDVLGAFGVARGVRRALLTRRGMPRSRPTKPHLHRLFEGHTYGIGSRGAWNSLPRWAPVFR